MPFVKANDINLYYETHGDGTPLVCIPGLNQTSLSYAPFIEPLSQYFRLILLDNRGAGQSEAPTELYNLKMFVEDTAALLDELNIESAHILGTSMGAAIGQKLCIDHPDRVKKLILCAPFAKLPNCTQHNIRSQLKLLAKGISLADLLELNAAWLFSNKFLATPENLQRFLSDLAKNPYPSTVEGIQGQAHALLNINLEKELKNIPHATLLLVGEQDINTPLYCAQLIQGRIPNCQTHIFKEMGHMFNYENPKGTCKQVLKFLLQE